MRIALCILVSLVLGVNLRADEKLSREDATLIFEAMQQKYRSLSCDHLRESNMAPIRVPGQYFQAENGWVRGVCKRSDAFDTDTIIKNNVHANYRRFLNTIEIRPARTTSGFEMVLMLSDAWEMAGMRFYIGRDIHPRAISDYLADRTTEKDCSRLPNGDIVIISTIFDQKKFVEKCTFSKEHNFMFKSKTLLESGTDKILYEKVTQSYVQSNGLFFPKVIISTSYDPDKRTPGTPDIVSETITFSNVSINKPIPLTTFGDHVGKPGTSIVDTISQTVDVIDSNGVRKKTDMVMIDPTRADAQTTSTESTSTTIEQKRTIRISVGIAVIAVGVVLGIGITVRRARNRGVK